MDTRPRCKSCGQVLREYKQRDFPTRDKVIELLKVRQPRTAHELAEATGIKYISITRLLRQYAEQGFITRKGFEKHTHRQAYTRFGKSHTNTIAVPSYRTLWGLP